METLVLSGKTYVKASKAARDLGYTSDYVGQLCRGGHVDAHLVGRTWYVNPDTLTVHRIEKKRNARVKAREYAKKAIEESRSLSVNKTKNTYKNIPIRYETDKAELIPETRKILVDGEKFMPVPQERTALDRAPYVIVNENKKVIMSGTLNIQDADAEVTLTDTTILTPTMRRSHRTHGTKETHAAEIDKTVGAPVQKSFVERVQEFQDAVSDSPEAEDQSLEAGGSTVEPLLTTEQTVTQPVSWAPYIAGLIVVSTLALLSVYCEQGLVWQNQSLVTHYSFDFQQALSLGLK